MTKTELVEKLDAKVKEYLASVDVETRNQMAVLMELKEQIWEETQDKEEVDSKIQELEKNLADYESMLGHDPTKDKTIKGWIANIEKELSFIQSEKERFIDTKPYEISQYFNKISYREANYMRINNSLSKIATSRHIYNRELVDKSLQVIQDCYGFEDFDLAAIVQFMCQVKKRIRKLYDRNGKCDIRNYSSLGGWDMMLAFYTEQQGAGKSMFAQTIADVVSEGTYSVHGADEIMGTFGTLDVFRSPIIIMNEFGKQNKETTDELKKYANGETVSVNQKYKDAVTNDCFASFILTSNFDPMQLNGQDTGSRRIFIVQFPYDKPRKSLEEVTKAVKDLWSCICEDTLEVHFDTTAENMCKENLGWQQKCTISEFMSTLSEDAVEWLEYEKHSLGKIHHYLLNTEHLQISRNKVKAILCNKDYFDETSRDSTHTMYQLKAGIFEL